MKKLAKSFAGILLLAVAATIALYLIFPPVPDVSDEELGREFHKNLLNANEQNLLRTLTNPGRQKSEEEDTAFVIRHKFPFRGIFYKLLQMGQYYKFSNQPDSAKGLLLLAQKIAQTYEKNLNDPFLARQYKFCQKLDDRDLRRKLQIDYHYNLGQKALYQNHNDQARQQYKYSLRLSYKIHDLRREVDNLLKLQYFKYLAGDYNEAVEIAKKALALSQSAGYQYRQTWSHFAIATTLFPLSDYRQSLPHLEAGLKIAKQLDDQRAIMSILERIGVAARRLGNFKKALAANQESLQMSLRMGNKQNELRCYINSGLIRRSMGEYSKAKKDYEKALHLADELHDENKAVALINLGFLCQTLGLYDEARKYSFQALDLNIQSGNHYDIALALKNIGDIDFAQKADTSALKYYQRALREIENQGKVASDLRPSRLDSEIRLSMGDIYYENHQWPAAQGMYQHSLELFNKIGFKEGQAHALIRLGNLFREIQKHDEAENYLQGAIEIAEQLQDPLLLSNASYGIARLDAERGKMDKAEQEFARAIETIEKTRRKIVGSPRISYFTTVQDVYEAMILFQFQQGNYESAFNFSERSRARAFYDLFQANAGGISNKGNLQELPPSLKEIQAGLDENIQLIEFKVTRDKLLFFLIDRQNIQIAESPITRQKLKKFVFDFRRNIGAREDSRFHQRLKENPKRVFNQTLKLAKKLYQVCFQPVQDKISQDKVIYLIPEDVLNYLPFAALAFPEENSAKFLVQKYALAYAPSAAILSYTLRNHRENPPNSQPKVLAVGNPTGELYGAQNEVKQLAKIFPGTKTLMGQQVTKPSLLAALKNPYDVIHFATHAIINEVRPLESCLILGKTASTSESITPEASNGSYPPDHILTTQEILNLEIPTTHLVTLSACKTAGGRLYRGEGIVGLTRAFLQAGAGSVLTSLWDIDDKYTEKIMVAFYKNLKEKHLNKVRALQQAQVKVIQEMMNDEIIQYPHPYGWAAFTLTGNYSGHPF